MKLVKAKGKGLRRSLQRQMETKYIYLIVFKSIRILQRRGQEVRFPLTAMILKEFLIDFIQKDSQHTPPFSATEIKQQKKKFLIQNVLLEAQEVEMKKKKKNIPRCPDYHKLQGENK